MWDVSTTGTRSPLDGDFTADEDPGVRSVRDIYGYCKSNGIETIVMGASFRNIGQIEALAGCDRLTIASVLMDALASQGGEPKRVLTPAAAEPRALRTAEDGICHWLVSEDAVDIKHPDPAGPIDETTFRWIMNEDAMATEKLAEGIRVLLPTLDAPPVMIIEARTERDLVNGLATSTAASETALPAR